MKLRRLLVLVNKRLPGITIYDADTWTVVHRLGIETVAPHEVALSNDGRTAYVPIYGSSGVGKPGTDEHTLHFFDTVTGEQHAVLDTGEFRRLHSIVVGRSGRLYVSAEVSGVVLAVDPSAVAILGTIPTGSLTSHMITLTADESTLYSSNVQAESISVMDVASRSLLETIPTEGPNQRITLSPDESLLVTSLGPAKKVAAYRRVSGQLAFSVDVDGVPFTAKFSRDGTSLFNVGTKDGETCVWKIDVASRKLAAAKYGLGGDPGSLEVNPFDGRVFISDQPSRKLHLLCPDSLNILRTMDTDPSPDAMAFAQIA